jgi:hypothetical protein
MTIANKMAKLTWYLTDTYGHEKALEFFKLVTSTWLLDEDHADVPHYRSKPVLSQAPRVSHGNM